MQPHNDDENLINNYSYHSNIKFCTKQLDKIEHSFKRLLNNKSNAPRLLIRLPFLRASWYIRSMWVNPGFSQFTKETGKYYMAHAGFFSFIAGPFDGSYSCLNET